MAEYDDVKYEVNGDGDDGYELEPEQEDITSEDCWKVISSFFEIKKLASMQIDSFNHFMRAGLQDLINEKGGVTLDHAENVDEDDPNPVLIKRHEVKFGKVTLSKPNMTEAEGTTADCMPHEARMRSLTYASPVFVRMSRRTYYAKAKPWDEDDKNSGVAREDGTELFWKESDDPEDYEFEKEVFLGKVPIMVRSMTCHLVSEQFQGDRDLFAWGECPYDQGGYFIINGSEKVLIAQERSAGNIVQVFQKAAPSPFTHLAEIRSVIDKGNRMMSQCTVKLFRRVDGPDGTKIDNPIRVQLPYVKQDIPLVIVFRALDIVSDADILEKIVFDQSDKEMMDMLMGSLQEGQAIQGADLARDFIARRGNAPNLKSHERQKHATDILQKEFLPHIGQTADATARKAFFLGYMINRLLKCALGRAEPDDRDHLGKKRLDLAGPLMTNLFRLQLDKATKDFSRYMTKRV
jgi:DNA-directed RNA polymerase II subunit RPB2